MTNEATARRGGEAMDPVERVADPIDRLRMIMKRLLDPGGCPWDREQTHQTLRQYLLEEAYEAAEAIDSGDDRAMCEELGDVALQVVFHAELAERRGAFRLEDIYAAIGCKLIERHPHVFGDGAAADAEEVLRNWEQIKKEEKRKKAESVGGEGHKVSALSGVPKALPALQRAARLQSRAAKVGFDWDHPADVAAKVREEVEEFLEHAVAGEGSDGDTANGDAARHAKLQEEFGDLLFALVNLTRFLDVRAEEALSAACTKFTRRFESIEHAAEAQGKTLGEMTLAEMDALWDEAKAGEA